MQKLMVLKKMVFTFVLSFFVLFLNSCVYCVVGGIGAFGGYVASPDTVEGIILDRSYEEIWRVSLDTLSSTGVLEQRSEEIGILQAQVNGARVKIKVFRVGKESVKLSVKARQHFFPKIRTAQDVYVKIVSSLDVEPQSR